jgi:Sigma-70 factor, region 1.1
LFSKVKQRRAARRDKPHLVGADLQENSMEWSEIVRKLIIVGKAQGYVTFDQLNELIPAGDVRPEEIEALLTILQDRGIDLVPD